MSVNQSTAKRITSQHTLWNNSVHFSSRVIALNMLLIFTSISELSGLTCVCNPDDCDLIRQIDCPGKGQMVFDPCKCCKVCAKTVGETCGGLGGFAGTCEEGLKCISKPPVIGTGVCLELPSADNEPSHTNKLRNCQETIEIQPGCEIVDRKCECWNQPIAVCKENLVRWDFANAEECELNLANLYKSEVEFDEDYTIPPKNIEFTKVLRKRRRRKSKKHHGEQLSEKSAEANNESSTRDTNEK